MTETMYNKTVEDNERRGLNQYKKLSRQTLLEMAVGAGVVYRSGCVA